MESLSNEEARRISLAAQGFGGPRRLAQRQLFARALERLHVLQIDSVNVFARSHYLPVFSRHGSYDTTQLDATLWGGTEFTEYWAHEAAFIPVADRALFGWRMDDFREKYARSGQTEAMAKTLAAVRKALGDGGPQFVQDLEAGPREKRGPWWDWSDTKRAVEMMFAWGEVVSTGREGFRRRYALAEHVMGPELLSPVDRGTAQRRLIERASRSLGVATAADLGDYHRLRPADARAAIRTLADEGVLVPVSVDGWLTSRGDREAAWMHRDAQVPTRLAPDALLTPFDPVVWFRPRALRIFDFHYRIEIYTPKEKRQYGYYCLPLMVGGRLVGRLDLKADRAQRHLLVQAAWQEAGAPPRTAEAATALLARAAAWQGLSEVRSAGVGSLVLPARINAA